MWKIFKVYLPKFNINRYIKREVLYGDIDVQGLGIKNIFLTQGTSHVTNIVEHFWKQTIMGHLIKSSLEQLRLEIGTNISILNSNYEEYQHRILTESWVQQTWNFMSQYNITLEDDTTTVPLKQVNDSILMDEKLKHDNFSPSEVKALKTIRIKPYT